MYSYKGISFAKDLNVSLAEFKEMFASNRVFKEVPHLDRDAELEKVHKEVMQHNGFDTSVSEKSKSDKTKSSKK